MIGILLAGGRYKFKIESMTIRLPNPENPRTIPAAKAVGAISHKNSADVSTMNWVCGAQGFWQTAGVSGSG
jgi:hypothetical protein